MVPICPITLLRESVTPFSLRSREILDLWGHRVPKDRGAHR